MNDQEQVLKGERVARLLKDPDLIEALADIEGQIYRKWREATSPEARERAHHLDVAVSLLRVQLDGAVSNGKVAQNSLQKLANKAKEALRWKQKAS